MYQQGNSVSWETVNVVVKFSLYSLELIEQDAVVGLAGNVDGIVGLADVVGSAVYTIGAVL